jgi:small-conductance mechanosensitive channel
MNLKKILTALAACMLLPLSAMAQETTVEQLNDSARAQQDSMVAALQNRIHELELKGIVMQEQLQRSGKSQQLDSLQQVQRRLRVDSLRRTTKGSPLVVDGDTLLTIYARKGGMQPEARVEAARKKILAEGHSLTFHADSVYLFDSDVSTDIMAGEEVLLSVTDLDALWHNTSRTKLATEYAQVIGKKIQTLHHEYGLQQKIWGVLLAVLILVAQYFAIKLTNWLFSRWKFRFTRRLLVRFAPLAEKNYGLFSSHRQGIIAITTLNLVRIAAIAMQLLVSIPLLFSFFPETKTFTFTLIGYIWNPAKSILLAVVGYMPNLFQIIVIFVCFRYLVKGIHYVANEIAEGRIRLNGFYPDWAEPTYYILRILAYSLMFVMIWPLLPNSNSEVFQGVSVFIGIVFSLGSTSVIGNVIAGLVMTYMRPFHIGDYIQFGDTEGEVIEKTVLVTRIRTRKNNVVTIPNSSLMSSQTSNFTFAAKHYGIILHTKITIGYDVPWQQVEKLMLNAAAATEGILKTPKPFVLTTQLDDFYVEYELNAYTKQARTAPVVRSAMHRNILNQFHQAGVEIMSPHIIARRDGLDTQIPPAEG